MGTPGVSAQTRLGRYELLARLATGGMGEIFLARLEGAAGFEKLYVVKRILPHLADDARFRQMLISEAQIAAKMSHSNICQVYELGETQGQLYIAMEYLEGVTMLPLLRKASKAQASLDFGFVAGVVQQACDALQYAHELKDRGGEYLGLIHRDVTPANIFLTESGVVKILDFGIAKAKGASSTKTEDGAVKGKYAYMAPEQLRGGGIDRRVDLFALGVVMYEMLALRRLFQRKTDYLTFRAVMEQPIPDIRRYRPDIPDGIADAVTRALDRDPAQRFETARQLGNAILDGVAAAQIRPWTQGEIGDLVKANFANELGKRSQQVTNAVNRTTAGVNSQRATMPLIAQSDAASDEGESGDDDGFPSVETDVDSTSPRFGGNDRPITDPFQSSTPPPFASLGESTGSAPSLQPLRGSAVMQTPGPVVVVGHRSLLWPMVAIAMVAIAGGALFLVWKQMQNQQPQQPAVINLTQEHETQPPVEHTPVPPPDKGSAVATAGSDDDQHGPGPGHAVKPPPKKFATYDQALAAQKSAMVQCLMDHRDGGLPNEAITAVINISANGHAKSVQLKPDALNAAPLGGCIRNVLMGAAFPNAPSDNTITVPLKPKAT